MTERQLDLFAELPPQDEGLSTSYPTVNLENYADYFPCVPASDCPYSIRPQGCHEVNAHLFYPESLYISCLERTWRNLPQNVERRCRRFEEASHATELPPEKPDHDTMLADVTRAVQEGVLTLSKTKQRKIYGRGHE